MRLNFNSIIPVAVAMTVFATFPVRASVQGMDPSSSVRGSLGATVFDLGLDSPLGAVSFFLNAGFALAFGVVALYLVARTHREWPSGSRPTRVRSMLPFLRGRAGA